MNEHGYGIEFDVSRQKYVLVLLLLPGTKFLDTLIVGLCDAGSVNLSVFRISIDIVIAVQRTHPNYSDALSFTISRARYQHRLQPSIQDPRASSLTNRPLPKSAPVSSTVLFTTQSRAPLFLRHRAISPASISQTNNSRARASVRPESAHLKLR